MSKIIVPDSNLFIKLFHPESDSEDAKVFFKTCAELNSNLIVPELFQYEISAVVCEKHCDLKPVLDLFLSFKHSILTVTVPDESTWLLAEKIVRNGHPKSGFPSIYDSIYHALAIQSGGVFLTADEKHFSKAKDFQHITLLKDWENIFISH